MASIIMKCVHCLSEKVVKNRKQSNGKQPLKCKDCGKTFQEEYSSNGAKPEVKLLVIKMNLNGSGIRDTAQVLEKIP